jgi:hypothetical protein
VNRNLSDKQFKGYSKTGNEGLDRVPKVPFNKAAQREQEFSWSYDINHPRPKGSENVTQPGA